MNVVNVDKKCIFTIQLRERELMLIAGALNQLHDDYEKGTLDSYPELKAISGMETWSLWETFDTLYDRNIRVKSNERKVKKTNEPV